MNKGYFVPVTIIGLLLVLAGIVLFVPFTQTDIPNQNIKVDQGTTENTVEEPVLPENEEVPPVVPDDTQEETTGENEEATDSLPKIPASIPTPECAQDPNCANQLGCTTDPETGLTICY